MAPKLYSLALLCCPPAAGRGEVGRVNARQESPEKKLTNFRMNISLIFLKGDRNRHKEQDDDCDWLWVWLRVLVWVWLWVWSHVSGMLTLFAADSQKF